MLTHMKQLKEYDNTQSNLTDSDMDAIRKTIVQCISSDEIAARLAEKLGLTTPESDAIDSDTARRLLGGISRRTFYLYLHHYPELRIGCSRRYSRSRVMELKFLRQTGQLRCSQHAKNKKKHLEDRL